MSNFKRLITLILLIINFFACVKEETLPLTSIIYTEPLKDISNYTITLEAKVISFNDTNIIEYGFIWGTELNPNSTVNKIISLGNHLENKFFTSKLNTTNLSGGITYYYRSFIRTSDLVYYGMEQSFTLRPKIESIIPKEGCRGIQLAIVGYNFYPNINSCQLLIDNNLCEITYYNKDTIWFKIDSLIDEGEKDVTLKFEKDSITKSKFYIHHEPWKKLKNFEGIGRYHAIGFSIGTKAYIGGGMDKDYNQLYDFWEYDQENNEWSRKEDIPIISSVTGTSSFSTNKYGYFGVNKHFWKYDPTINKWSEIKEFPGDAISYQSVFVINEKSYLGSGRIEGYGNTPEFWEYNENTNTWIKKNNMPFSSIYGIGFSINNMGYMGDGDSMEFWEYNPSNDTWTKKSDLIKRLFFPLNVSTDNNGYIFNISENLEYDPVGNVWNKKLFIPESRIFSIGFSINNKCYLGTGYHNDLKATNDFYEYDPSKDIFTEITQ